MISSEAITFFCLCSSSRNLCGNYMWKLSLDPAFATGLNFFIKISSLISCRRQFHQININGN